MTLARRQEISYLQIQDSIPELKRSRKENGQKFWRRIDLAARHADIMPATLRAFVTALLEGRRPEGTPNQQREIAHLLNMALLKLGLEEQFGLTDFFGRLVKTSTARSAKIGITEEEGLEFVRANLLTLLNNHLRPGLWY